MLRGKLALVLVTLAALGLTSCSTDSPAAKPATTQSQVPGSQTQGKVEWIDPAKIQPGPVRRDSLTDDQMNRIKKLQQIFVEVDGQPLDKWVDDFKRDMDPDREIRIWERMAKAYVAYTAKHDLSLEAKKEVNQVVLLRSMSSEEDVLARLKLKKLSQQDAKEIMEGY